MLFRIVARRRKRTSDRVVGQKGARVQKSRKGRTLFYLAVESAFSAAAGKQAKRSARRSVHRVQSVNLVFQLNFSAPVSRGIIRQRDSPSIPPPRLNYLPRWWCIHAKTSATRRHRVYTIGVRLLSPYGDWYVLLSVSAVADCSPN